MFLKKVDVILASYNGEKYIKEQINSILLCLDKVKDHECQLLISDDCSQDGTLKIISEINDDRVKLIDSTRAGGVLANFERLIKYSNADYVFFADQDDIWIEDKVSVFLDAFNKIENEHDSTPVLLYSDVTLVNTNLNVIHNSMMEVQKIIEKPSFCELLVSNSVTGCAMAANRVLLNKIKKINEHDVIMHDWYLALVAKSTGYLKFVPGQYVLYRQHGGNQVGSKIYQVSDKMHPTKLLKFIKKSRGDIIRTINQAYYFKTQHTNENFNSIFLNDLNSYIEAKGSLIKRINNVFSGKFQKKGRLRNIIYIMLYLTI